MHPTPNKGQSEAYDGWIGVNMSDAMGHGDRPGANPFNSASITRGGIPTNHYWYHNPTTEKFEVVRFMARGTLDVVVREFDSLLDLRSWTLVEWRSGRLR